MSTATKPKPTSADRRSTPPAATPQTKPTALMDIAKSMQDLLEPFGWGYNEPALLLNERREIWQCLQLVDHVDPSAGGETPIPKYFWNGVVMPDRVLPTFRSCNDAMALAIAACQTLEQLVEWRNIVEDRDPEAMEAAFLEFLERCQAGITTAAGDVFTDPKNMSVWFGRKAGRVPALHDRTSMLAIETLFNIAVITGEKCRVCGCTEEDCRQCIEATGQPCHWVEKDLCSRCAEDADEDAAVAHLHAARKAAAADSPATATKPKAAKAKKDKGQTVASSATKSEATETIGQQLSGSRSDSLRMVSLKSINPDPANDRKNFDKEALQQLADSIKQHGILQPLLLRPDPNVLRPSGTEWKIVAGERRYRAAKLAGLTQVPAQIVTPEALQTSLMRLEENLKREDLTPIERAQAIRRLIDDHKLTQTEVAKRLGITQGQVSNELRLLNLPDSLQVKVADGHVAPTLIRCVLPFADIPAITDGVRERIEFRKRSDHELTVDELENVLETLVDKNSRSMRDQSRDQVHAWSSPQKDYRYFSKVTPEQLQQLDVRKVKTRFGGEQERAFNVKLFDQLNKEPLKAKLAKYRELKAKNSAASGRSSATKVEGMFQNQWNLERAIEDSLKPLLADVMEKTKPSSQRQKLRAVCMTLLTISGEMECAFLGNFPKDTVPKLLSRFDVAPAELDKLLCQVLVKDLRSDFPLNAVDSIELAKALGVDLVAMWKPTDDVRKQLTDAGRQQLEAAAGTIPGFLRPFFGLPAEPKKAAKKKAKAA
jgi:ParB family chromosome partitioning protein